MSNSEKSLRDRDICRRIAALRRRLHGDRGKSRFAEQLGISPSTYNYYEARRVPPAGVLVRIADAAGVDIRWLLTGEDAEPSVSADHPAVRRIAVLLAEHPSAAAPLVAFVDILAASLAWPSKSVGAGPGGHEVEHHPVQQAGIRTRRIAKPLQATGPEITPAPLGDGCWAAMLHRKNPTKQTVFFAESAKPVLGDLR